MGFFDLFKKKEAAVEPAPVETPPVVNNDAMPQATVEEPPAAPAPEDIAPEAPATDDLPPAAPAE